jgi:hypothetical protein
VKGTQNYSLVQNCILTLSLEVEWKGTEFLRCYKKGYEVKRAITIICFADFLS